MLAEVLSLLDPQPGQTVVDVTVGWAGHAAEILDRLGPPGRLIGLDLDAENLAQARARLDPTGHPFTLHHANFAGLTGILAAGGTAQVDAVLADLGMSSMQVDDAERGFSYTRDGPLDMRMDRSRGRSAAQVLATIPEADLAQALRELGDEPQPDQVAAAIVRARLRKPLERTVELARVIVEATHPEQAGQRWRIQPERGRWKTHPAARAFQALRILVNRELANLQQLLRVLPEVLKVGGRVAIISFHSGEDRLVKAAFRDGQRAGTYEEVSEEPLRPSFEERTNNPRSRSAKLRWARRPYFPRSS
jgi:16S rRNA (cytosine1402-N4)-methyltransferase